MKKNKYKVNISISSSAGIKKTNEDSSWVGFNTSNQCLAIVCDGIGSEKNSENASSTIVKTFKKYFEKTKCIYFPKYWFRKVLNIAYEELNNYASKLNINKDIGTTLVLTLLSGGVAYIFNIGDSRAYFYNIEFHSWNQETVDHNLYTFFLTHNAPQSSYIKHKDNLLSLTNYISSNSTKRMNYSTKIVKFKVNDVFFLASDGLYNYIDINKINEVISTSRNKGFDTICPTLIKYALENQSNDNLTGIILEISNLN